MKYIGIISYLILNFDLNWSFIDSNVSLHEINPPPKKIDHNWLSFDQNWIHHLLYHRMKFAPICKERDLVILLMGVK